MPEGDSSLVIPLNPRPITPDSVPAIPISGSFSGSQNNLPPTVEEEAKPLLKSLTLRSL